MAITMNDREMQNFLEGVIVPMLLEVRAQGQSEYAQQENAFANFDKLAQELRTTPEMVLWIYLRKHMDGILAHINGHESQREPVEGRLKDAIMYLCLLWGMQERHKLNKSEA